MIRSVVLLSSLVLISCATKPFYEEAPTTPVNISPSDSVDLVAGNPAEFVWTAAERVDYYEFHIFNRKTADIRQYYLTDLMPEAVCSADRCSVQIDVDLPILNDHAWRVRAINNAGSSNWTRSLLNMVGR